MPQPAKSWDKKDLLGRGEGHRSHLELMKMTGNSEDIQKKLGTERKVLRNGRTAKRQQTGQKNN